MPGGEEGPVSGAGHSGPRPSHSAPPASTARLSSDGNKAQNQVQHGAPPRAATRNPTQVLGLSPGDTPDHDWLQAVWDRSVASSLCTGRPRLTPGFLIGQGTQSPCCLAARLTGRYLQPGQESRSCPQRRGTCALMGQSTGRLSHQVLLDQTQPEEERTHTSIDCHSSLVHGPVKFFQTILFFRSYRIYQKKKYLQRKPPKKQAQRRRHSCLPDSRRVPANLRSETCPSPADHQKPRGQFPKRLAHFGCCISQTTDPAKSPASEVCLSRLNLPGLHAHVRTAQSGHNAVWSGCWWAAGLQREHQPEHRSTWSPCLHQLPWLRHLIQTQLSPVTPPSKWASS